MSATADERDALWSLAPAGASVGVVVSPGGLGAIEHAAAALHGVLASSTADAPLDGAFVRGLVATVGKTKLTLEQHGLDRRHGLAVFVTAERQRTLVLPVADRDKFLTAMRGTKQADGDELAGLVCKPVGERYVCVERREAFAALSKRGLDDVRKHDPARGDIEVALRSVPGLGGSAVAAAEITRGALIVRGALRGVSRDIVQMLGAPSRPREGAEAAAGFGVFSVAPMLAMAPTTPLVPGATLASVGRAVSGPITYLIAGGTEDPAIRIPLHDGAPMRALVENCTKLQMMAAQGATVRDGVCRVPIGATTALDVWVDGSELRIANRIAASPSALAPTPLARELAQREWAVSIFGRGSYLDLRSMESHLPQLITHDVELRLMSLINELGVGMRRDGEVIRFVAGARTVWSNPDEVQAKLLAISSDDLRSGKAVEIARGIADRAPESPFAHDLRAGLAGFAGLSVPARVLMPDVVEPPLETPASIHLAGAPRKRASFPLVAARAAVKTTVFSQPTPTPAPKPPKQVFVRTHYRSPAGQLVAYETPPRPGPRRPAIIWIHGGLTWDIDGDLWKPQPRSNDQTAAVLRIDGLVLMVPALRGASGNPGKPECFLGEVDDILAAAEHLAQRPDVDPARIYLGGHSTGGTLALLAAASTDRFRAVFAFGPVSDPRHYGDDICTATNKTNAAELAELEWTPRAPIRWIDTIVTPTLVIEGANSGNAAAFPELRRRASSVVQFLAVPGADHFDVLAPTSEMIARAIVADTGPTLDITFDTAAIARAAAATH